MEMLENCFWFQKGVPWGRKSGPRVKSRLVKTLKIIRSRTVFIIDLSLHVPEHIDLNPLLHHPWCSYLVWWTNCCSNFLSHYEDVEPLRILCSTKAFLVVQPKILRYVHSTTIYLLSLSNSSYPKYTRVISLKTISGEGHLSNTHYVHVPL